MKFVYLFLIFIAVLGGIALTVGSLVQFSKETKSATRIGVFLFALWTAASTILWIVLGSSLLK